MFNKDSILRRIQDFYDLPNRGSLAAFLGVNPSTLSNWVTRDTLDYELIFSKCKELNYEYILTGEGLMLKKKSDIFSEENSSPAFKPSIQAQHESFQAQHSSSAKIPSITTDQLSESELLPKLFKSQEALLKAKNDIIEGKDAVIAAKEAQLAIMSTRIDELTAQLNDTKKQHPSAAKTAVSDAAASK